VLTHLRTELVAEHQDASLTEGTDEPLTGKGDGSGRQNTPLEERLSALINALNERFGLTLTDADQIWFAQQQQVLAEQEPVRDAAQGNDLDQFTVYVTPLIDQLIVGRHEANDELFRAYFDKPDFKQLMADALVKNLYDQLRTAS